MKCKKKVGLLDKEEAPNSELVLSRLLLNHKITKTALLKDANNTAVVSNAAKKGTLAKLSIYKKHRQYFFKTLESSLSAPKFAIEIDGENRLTTAEKISGL
jgi:hypothetical protein